MRRMRRLARGDRKEQRGLRELALRPTMEKVIATMVALRGERWEQWRDRYGDWGRDAVLWPERRRCGLKLGELGMAVGGLDYRSVSSALRQFARRLHTDKKLARQLKIVDDRSQKNETPGEARRAITFIPTTPDPGEANSSKQSSHRRAFCLSNSRPQRKPNI